MKSIKTKHLVIAALLIAVGMVLPFLTGQIPSIGKVISPLHIPALLAGFAVGPCLGALVGLVIPLMRSVLFGMPPLFPMATAMAIELMMYALIAGLVYDVMKKNVPGIYVAMVIAMIAGRAYFAIAMALFTHAPILPVFFGTFTKAWIGILIHLALIPAIVIALKRAKMIE